jgi:hypothetical protein
MLFGMLPKPVRPYALRTLLFLSSLNVHAAFEML